MGYTAHPRHGRRQLDQRAVASAGKAAAVGAVGAGAFMLAGMPGVANAAPLAYHDTSVSVTGTPVVDSITGIKATLGGTATDQLTASPSAPVQVTTGTTLTFTATDSTTPMWTVPGGSVKDDGFIFQFNGASVLGMSVDPDGATDGNSLPTGSSPIPGFSIPVEATDAGGAVATAKVNVSDITLTGGKIYADLSLVPDTVTLTPAADNADGTVNIGTASGYTETVNDGFTLKDGVLSAKNLAPNTYNGVTVTAKDAAGSTAVETLDVTVKGNAVTPAPAPKPSVQVLSHGHAVEIAPTREDVTFDASKAGWVEFQITGPGAINGHKGWVDAQAGANEGVYTGLDGNHHGYTVTYTPVASQGSTVATGKPGQVYFVTNTNVSK